MGLAEPAAYGAAPPLRRRRDWLHQTGLQALDAVDIIELYASGAYTPANGAVYPQTWFGENLQTIAQMTKLDLGLRVATLDLGGWDTHENQGNAGGGMYAGLVGGAGAGPGRPLHRPRRQPARPTTRSA